MSHIPKDKIEELLKEIRQKNEILNKADDDLIREDLSELPPIPLNTEILFGIDSPIAPYLRDGWSQPEQTRIWSTNKECDLVFKIPETKSDLILTFNGEQFRAKGIEGTAIELWLDDKLIGCWPENHITALSTLILFEQLPAEGVARLTFRFKDPKSPKSLGISEDNRLLAFSFKSFLIKEIF